MIEKYKHSNTDNARQKYQKQHSNYKFMPDSNGQLASVDTIWIFQLKSDQVLIYNSKIRLQRGFREGDRPDVVSRANRNKPN